MHTLRSVRRREENPYVGNERLLDQGSDYGRLADALWVVCQNGDTEKGLGAHRRLRVKCEHPFSCPSPSLASVRNARAVYVVEESSARQPANRPKPATRVTIAIAQHVNVLT